MRNDGIMRSPPTSSSQNFTHTSRRRIPKFEASRISTHQFRPGNPNTLEEHQTTEDVPVVSPGLDEALIAISMKDVLATIQEIDGATDIEIVINSLKDWI